MECLGTTTAAADPATPACAYKLLFEAAMAIPTWHYMSAMAFFCMVFLYNFLEFHFLEDIFSGFRGSPVSLTYNPCSEIYHQVASKCQNLHGRYLATPWLCSPHIQTTFINFFGRPPVFRYRREMFDASDGGTFALDWLTNSDVSGDLTRKSHPISKDETTPIMVVIPGLTSDSASPYMQQLAFYTAKHGFNVVIINHRGLGGVSVTSDCFYNAGWTEDVRDVNDYLHSKYPNAPLFVVGTSIGANILVKYLGEHGENVPVAGAVAICSPWDLLIGSRFIARRLVQKFYDRALTIGLQGYAQLHQTRYSRLADWEGIRKSCSIRDFDTYATCLVGKYETVDTYYRRSSSSPYVGCVAVPLLCVGALDDPLCTKEAVPWDECRANRNIVLAMTKHGGHLAFFEGIGASSLWWVRAANEFLNVLHSSTFMHKQKKTAMDDVHPTMQSPIDHAPYISVSNGMVAAMGNEQTTNDVVQQSSGNQNVQCGTTETISETEPNASTTEAKSSNELGNQSSKEAAKSKRIRGFDTGILKRFLAQLSKHNKTSTWLLVYVAALSTWPLIRTVFKFLFARKVRKALTCKRQN